MKVESAEEMYKACESVFKNVDIAVLAAAVADYKPKSIADSKIKKKDSELFLELTKTTDILETLGQQKKHQLLVGFALETDNVLEYAKAKIAKKNLDFIVANSAIEKGAGFGVDTNKVTIIDKHHKITFNDKHFNVPSKSPATNPLGYYYKPHSPLTIRVFSDYIEEAPRSGVLGVPDYAYYSNLSNSFRWREIYTYGFIDTSDIGVDYPFLNGKHYPYSNYIFRVYPEGIGLQNINEITTPTVDECE